MQMLNHRCARAACASSLLARATRCSATECRQHFDTPNYRQKDLSLEKFQEMLRDAPSTRSDSAEPIGSKPHSTTSQAEIVQPIVGHPVARRGNNRSIPNRLMSDKAKNALMHNTGRRTASSSSSQTMEMALKDRTLT